MRSLRSRPALADGEVTLQRRVLSSPPGEPASVAGSQWRDRVPRSQKLRTRSNRLLSTFSRTSNSGRHPERSETLLFSSSANPIFRISGL